MARTFLEIKYGRSFPFLSLFFDFFFYFLFVCFHFVCELGRNNSRAYRGLTKTGNYLLLSLNGPRTKEHDSRTSGIVTVSFCHSASVCMTLALRHPLFHCVGLRVCVFVCGLADPRCLFRVFLLFVKEMGSAVFIVISNDTSIQRALPPPGGGGGEALFAL